MSAEENIAIVRRYYAEVLDGQNLAIVNALFAPSYEGHPPGLPPMNAEQFKQAMMGFNTAFPDASWPIEDIVAEGDRVAVRATMRGTNTGAFYGMPPTGRAVTMSVISIYRLAGGRIAEDWLVSNQLGLMRQLGVIPTPVQTRDETSDMTTQLQARNDDVELAAVEWPAGGSELPRLIALHGMGLRGEVWAGLAERLADRFRVVAPDIRGHGDSAKPPSGYGLADLTEDLRVWFDRLDAGRATLVAHSYGARVALNFAALFPGRVERLVAIEPLISPRGEHQEIKPEMLERMRQRSEVWPSREEMLGQLQTRKTEARWRPDRLRWYVDRCTEVGGDGLVRLIWQSARMATHIEETYAEPRFLEPWSYFEAVTCPVLIVRGDETALFSREAAEQLRDSLPKATLVELPGTHNLHLEHPEEVERCVADWLREAG